MSRKPLALVVEDDPSLCILFADMLPALGYAVIVLHHRPSASSITCAGCPDIVLADCMLDGDENGIEFAAGLQSQGVTCPMIAMSASNQELDHARASGLFAACIAKPFNMFEISAAIEQVLGGKNDSSD